MSAKEFDSEEGPESRERIEELESQVRELSVLVEALLSKQETPAPDPGAAEEAAEAAPEPPKPHLVDGVREGVGRALGGEEGESLESRIGGIWLGRVAVVITMTAVVLGGATTLSNEALQPVQKIAIGYVLAAFAVGYGLLSREKGDLFPQTLLGSGLAALYFTTYAGFFVETTRVFTNPWAAIPALGLCLLSLAVVAHLRRSQTAAGIALFLIYYTVVLSLTEGGGPESIYYAFITCSTVSLLAFVFHLTHRWLSFTWAALIASHLTYIFFFLAKPVQLDMTEEVYFWISNGFLTLNYVLFSAVCITDARKTGEFRRTVAPMAGVNSAVFLTLTWFAVREQYIEFEWVFRLGIAGGLGFFALYAALAGPKWNYLFQVYIAKMVLMFTLAMQAYLTNEWLLVAMALECLGLTISYNRSGLVIFKLLGFALLLFVFVGCLAAVRLPGEVALAGYTIPAKWIACVGVPLVLACIAGLYEHFVRPVLPEQRVLRGQWFLADSFLDVSSATMSLLHAAAGSLILLTITIIDLGNSPALPYFLAGESIVMVVVGFSLRTPQVEVASVLLLIAAHVCYHVFLFTGKAGFETQEFYAFFTVGVALLTFLGGYLWERFLRHVKGGTQREHEAVASLPYLAATLMLTTLMQRDLELLYVPLGQNLLGLALVLGGALTLLSGLRISSILALALGTASFYSGIYNFSNPLWDMPGFFTAFVLFLATYVAAERIVNHWVNEAHHVFTGAGVLRTGFVTVVAILGVLGLWEWAPEGYLTLYFLGLAVTLMALGAVFRESRYRWVALVVYLIAIGRAYAYDLTNLNPLYQFFSFTALCVPLLLISWAYSRIRLRNLRRSEAPPSEGIESDG